MGKVVIRPAINGADGRGGPSMMAVDEPCGLDSAPPGLLLIIGPSASWQGMGGVTGRSCVRGDMGAISGLSRSVMVHPSSLVRTVPG
jgi:hypothetical protein